MTDYIKTLLSIVLLLNAANLRAEQPSNFPLYSSDETFEDVMENVKDAIIGKGLNISNVLHASDMLNRTGPDLGFSENVFSEAQTIEFCSASLSHQLVVIDPSNMVLCPFTISVYKLEKDKDTIHLSYRKLTAGNNSSAVLEKVDTLIQEIIEEAIE